ncbi:MAG: hypothetical protein RIR12_1576 [Bacteroidota bacterium]|jgi:RHS repeat-associated protein
MDMPGRKLGSENRYGFNGKERDKDIASGNYDFGARIYDGRIGRWLSVDPLQAKYPGESPYMFGADNPNFFIDPDGRDRIISILILNADGTATQLKKVVYNKFTYEMSNSFTGGYHFTRYDQYINLVIDNRSGAELTVEAAMNNPNAGNIMTFERNDYVNGQPISGLTYLFGNTTGDQHEKETIGVFQYGKGLGSDFNKGFPMGAFGSETMDLSPLLDVLSTISPSSDPANIYSKISQQWREKTGRDMKEILLSLDYISQMVKGVTEVVSNSKTMIEAITKLVEINQKSGNTETSSSNNNITPRIEPSNSKPKGVYSGYKRGTILHTRTGNVRVNSDTTGTCCQDDKKATDTLPDAKKRN